MNLSEINKEFDLQYNNATSFSAAPVNMYMKSLYLTEAQEDLVLELYDKFEEDEKVREQLRNLVVNLPLTYDASLNSSLEASRFNTYSKFFEIPTNAWFILSEYINGDVEVVPTPLDEYTINIKNPFKKPLENVRAWRLDIGITDRNVREIIYPATISTYNLRYFKKPSPIILEDLTGTLTIENLKVATACIVSSELHRAIIKRAVDKAVLIYKENTPQARQALGER